MTGLPAFGRRGIGPPRVRLASRPIRLWAVLDPATPENRALTLALAGVFVLGIVSQLPLFRAWTPGVDLLIPLRAATRWAAGGQPYLASSFRATWGPDLPFLYPPWVLPLLVPLTALPSALVIAVWLLLGLGAAVWACRRLSIPWLGLPIVLAWPPFLEGVLTGNVQIFQFAAFAALFYLGPIRAGEDWTLRPRPLRPEDDAGNGVLAAGVGAFKYTQLVPLVHLLRRRPRAALYGLVVLAATIALLLSFTGYRIYGAWFEQLQRAENPGWPLVGSPLSVIVGHPLALAAAAVAVLVAFLVRGRDAGAWVGIATLVAAPSVHGYGLLFLLPALLTIRRDLALVLALALATYEPPTWWVAIAVTAATLAASNWLAALRADPPADSAREPMRAVPTRPAQTASAEE